MYIGLAIISLLSIAVIAFLQLPRFGKLPTGDRLKRIKQSPNYKDGSFQNQVETPNFTEGVGYYTVFKEFFFGQYKNLAPVDSLPTMKTDLLNLDINQDVLVWFGHSSYFIQIDKKRILVDPVFCGYASPFSFSIKAFKGTDVYTTHDIPVIDYLLITHDHWDHLDYQTIKTLKPKVKQVICGLGIGEHFEQWGYDENIIVEKDWNEKIILQSNFIIHTVPTRHFSGRGIKRNQALWVAFVLQTPTMKILIGGDGGYDNRFIEIGKTFGIFDLVILENGQYNKNWEYIHSRPEQVLQAAKELNAKRIFAVHNSKFALSNHAWHEPLSKISALNKTLNMPLITPMIGEQVNLKDNHQPFFEWWEK